MEWVFNHSILEPGNSGADHVEHSLFLRSTAKSLGTLVMENQHHSVFQVLFDVSSWKYWFASLIYIIMFICVVTVKAPECTILMSVQFFLYIFALNPGSVCATEHLGVLRPDSHNTSLWGIVRFRPES